MDFLEVGLIFLIALLTIFLTIAGVQVFFILRDLRKALIRLNQVLFEEEEKVSEKLKATVRNRPRRFFRK